MTEKHGKIKIRGENSEKLRAGWGGAGTCVTGLVKLTLIRVGDSQNHHPLSLFL